MLMLRNVDQAMLITFVDEMQSYLPKIRASLERFINEPSQRQGLEDAHHYVHTIKGAAAMLGLAILSHLTYYIEEVLEGLLSEQRPVSAELMAWVELTVDRTGDYLQGLLDGSVSEREIVTEMVQAYRRLKGLPEAEDAVTIANVIASQTPELNAIAVSSPESTETSARQGIATPAPPALDIDQELVEGFLEEANDYLNRIGQELPELARDATNRERIQTVRRSVHTLKGAAGVIGFRTMSQLAHRMEDLLDALYAGEVVLTEGTQHLLLATYDVLDSMVRDKGATTAVEAVLQPLYQSYAELLDITAPTSATETVSQEHAMSVKSPLASLDAEPDGTASSRVADAPESLGTTQEVAPVTPARRQLSELVRVPLARVDELVRLVGELVISRTTYEQQVASLSRQVEELHLSLERLRRVSSKVETYYDGVILPTYGEAHRRQTTLAFGQPPVTATSTQDFQDFDLLELDRYSDFALVSRELTETTADFSTLEQDFAETVGNFDSYLNRQERLTSAIQDKLRQLRMVPLVTLVTRLHRTVQVTAQQQGKQAQLSVEGQEVQFDKTVLEDIAEPLLHLLRNAVDHGIEPPALRQALGKAATGEIHIRAFVEGAQIVIQVSDDGAGLDPQSLCEAAVRHGFVHSDEALQIPQEQLYRLIFAPGFSTARTINEVSGRGVGMDVVDATVRRLKGHISLETTPGAGVTFTMRLPLTMALTRVLLVEVCGETFALPQVDINQILRLDQEKIERQHDCAVIRLGEHTIPLIHLGEHIHLRQPADSPEQRVPVVIVQTGDHQVAYVVDRLLGGREVVVKPLGTHLRRLKGIIGSTIMGDGRVVLILNPAELAREERSYGITPRPPHPPKTATVAEMLDILVVDDSFSVRRVVSNLIRSAGWNPIPAKDGLEALDIVQQADRLPDLILLDVEMPQMNGYELTSTLRAHDVYRHIPIVMLTSRSDAKHRQRAFDVGATEYLVKPYQDEVLLHVIRRLTHYAGDITAA